MSTVDAPALAPGEGYGDELLRVLDAERERTPIARSERGFEVFRYAEGQALLRDRRLGNDHMAIVRAVGIEDGPVYDFKERMLLSAQGERRTKLRIPVARFLSPAGATGMGDVVGRIADRIFDELAQTAECDLLELCQRMPAELYCHWVDAPPEEAPFVARISDQVLSIFQQDPGKREQIIGGYEELFPYLDARIEERRRRRGEDFLSKLIGLQEAGTLTELELRDYAAMLLEASTDNTAHQIANMLGLFLERPDVLHALAADAARIPAAVEEAIRFRSRMVLHDRTVREPLSVDGVDLPAGAEVYVWGWAANRDPRAFSDPERLDVTAERQHPPVNFGGGEYSCLGQHVARLEMGEVLRALVQRFPDASLTQPVAWWHTGFTSGASSIRVRLGDDRGQR